MVVEAAVWTEHRAEARGRESRRQPVDGGDELAKGRVNGRGHRVGGVARRNVAGISGRWWEAAAGRVARLRGSATRCAITLSIY